MHEHARLGRVKMICDYSGFAGYDDEMVKTWNGFYVLRRFAGEETQRHPQELVRSVREGVPGVTRPEPPDHFQVGLVNPRTDL